MDGTDDSIFNEPSVHLTMGLDTHVWCLSMAHLRWSLLQRCGKSFNLSIEDDKAYWNAMESIPLGFLGKDAWKGTIRSINEGKGISESYKELVSQRLKSVLVELEPTRWKRSSQTGNEAEDFPDESEIAQVVEYFVESHWKSLIDTQEDLFKHVDPSSEDSLLKAFHGTQDQNLIMEKFGIFSKSQAFAESFAQRRRSAQQRTKGLI